MELRVFVIFSLCLHVQNVESKNPGMLFFISNDVIGKMFTAAVNNQVPKAHDGWQIPAYTATRQYRLGEIDFKLFNMTWTPLQKPEVNAWTDDTHSMNIDVNGVTFKVVGQASIGLKSGLSKHRWEYGPYSIFGVVCVRIVLHGRVVNQTIVTTTCNAMNSCDVSFQIGLDHKIPTMIRHKINELLEIAVRHNIKSFSCNAAAPMNNTKLSYDGGMKLNDLFDIHTALTSSVQVDGQVHMNGTGMVESVSGQITPHDSPNVGDNSMMGSKLSSDMFNRRKSMQAVVSNYTISTLVYSAVKTGLLNGTLLGDALPPDERVKFGMDCKDQCFGKIFTTLAKKFPGQFVNVRMSISENLSSQITVNDIVFYTTLNTDFRMGNYSFINVTADLSTSFVPYIANHTLMLRGRIRFSDVNIAGFKVLSSNVGHVSESELYWIFDVLKKVKILPRLKEILAYGMDFTYASQIQKGVNPFFQTFQFREADVKLIKGAALFSVTPIFQ